MQSFNAEQLQEKWAPILDHDGQEKITDSHKRMVTAVLLENQEKTLKEEQAVSYTHLTLPTSDLV